MRIVVVTGVSGSGKSTAIRALEDIGYYTIDNFPIRLLDKLVELFAGTSGEIEKLALVVDARAARELEALPAVFNRAQQDGQQLDLLFLDASDDALARRYSETRRRHPLSPDGSVKGGITAERQMLEPVQHLATTTIDTTRMSVHDLKREIQHAFDAEREGQDKLSVTVMSFGFKHGVPTEADLMFDVRFLPNPYFVEELRASTGENEAVSSYVLEREEAKAFLEKATSLLEFLLPQYQQEGKVYLTLAIGCTGGRHRSVAIARYLGVWIQDLGFRAQVRHRDIDR